jgi:DNA-binding transcriptional LysR family regulator
MDFPSLSTDQVAAFVELARQGSLRGAAQQLIITEQGVRNRLLALEHRLGVQLYRKSRGVRRATPLTDHGQSFLPHALAFLERARELTDLFSGGNRQQEVHVVGSHYLIFYLLIDAVRRFHVAFPTIQIRLSTRNEQEVEQVLLSDPEVTVGLAAPYEPSRELEYRHLFSMDWSFIAARKHPLLKNKTLRLSDLVDQPLILFERGSTGRQHVIDAFHGAGLSPRVEMETTDTQVIVRMVEAGLGVSIVPLLPSGAVTRGYRVGVRSLAGQIQPIHSGVLTRRGEQLSEASRTFIEFVERRMQPRPTRRQT